MSSRTTTFVIIAILALLLINSSVFFVDQRQKVILLRLGEIQKADFKPGLHFKLPLINEIRRFDGRVMTLDSEPARYLTGEKKNVIVDSFIMWRISNVASYYTSMGGDEERAALRLSQIVKDGLRAEFGKRSLQDVVSGDRITMVNEILQDANKVAAGFGIQIVTIRIKRIDLPAEVSTSVYTRMEAERERVAKDLRSKGAEEAEKIRSDADRQRAVILADAKSQAETVRGEGDAKATEIYAEAYGQNKTFYDLFARLNAYKKVFTGNDMLVIQPKGDFFNRFDQTNDSAKQ